MEKQERRQNQNVQESEPLNPYMKELYTDIEKNLKKLKLPKDVESQVVAHFLEIAQQQFKAEKVPQKAYFAMQELVGRYTNVKDSTDQKEVEKEVEKVKEKLFSFIDTINRAKFEQAFSLQIVETPEPNESDIKELEVDEPEVWNPTEQEKIMRWQDGTTKLPNTFIKGNYVSFVRIPQLQNPKEPLYFYMQGKEIPKLPTAVVNAEVETFQVVKPKLGDKLTLENVGTISIYDSSEKTRKAIIQSSPEIAFDVNFGQELSENFWENTKVVRESSVDGSIKQGQLFAYDYSVLKGADTHIFSGKILGINNEGNVVVEILGDKPKKFAIDRKTWMNMRRLKTDVNRSNTENFRKATPKDIPRTILQYAENERDLEKIMEIIRHQEKNRMRAEEGMPNYINVKKFDTEISEHLIDRYLDELKDGKIQPENLVQFILEKNKPQNSQNASDLKEILNVLLEFYTEHGYSKQRTLKSIKETLKKYQELEESTPSPASLAA